MRIADPRVKADVGFAADAGEDEEGGEGTALEELLLLLLLLCEDLVPLKWKALLF